MSSQKHEYSTLEVLRRGVPMEHIPAPEITDHEEEPFARLNELYRNWLRTSDSLTAILSSYGQLFAHSEYMLQDEAMAQQLAHLNGPHLMSGMIGGDVEAGILEVVSSWDMHRSSRQQQQAHAKTRYEREGRRIAKIVEKIASETGDEIELTECSRQTMRNYSSDVTPEGLRLAMQLGTYDVLGHLLEHASQPPQRGIKEVGNKIIRLASEAYVTAALYGSTTNIDTLRDSSGAIIEAEALLLLWHACRIGELTKAWPIAASQRLDYGYFRTRKDMRNTDMLCMFLADDITIPIQIHGASGSIEGEGSSLVVIHSKDLYVPTARDKRFGSVILGFLGEKGGFSMDYLDMRATFIASKINTLRRRIVSPTVKHGILVR